jgi:predicted transcriptional regulator
MPVKAWRSRKPRHCVCIWRILQHNHRMTVKRMVLEAVEQVPEDASFDEIARRLEVVAAIQKGLASLDRGEGKSIDEVEKLVASWTTK